MAAEFVYLRTRGPRDGITAAIYWDGYRKSKEESHELLHKVEMSDADCKLSLMKLEEKYPLPERFKVEA